MKKEVAKALSMTLAVSLLEEMILGEHKTDEESKKKHLKDVCESSLEFLPKKVEITDYEEYVSLMMGCESAFMIGMLKGDLDSAEVMIEKLVERKFDDCLKVVETDGM